MKAKGYAILALLFLFGQIPIMWFFIYGGIPIKFGVPLVWSSAILCGWFSHWVVVLANDEKKELV